MTIELSPRHIFDSLQTVRKLRTRNEQATLPRRQQIVYEIMDLSNALVQARLAKDSEEVNSLTKRISAIKIEGYNRVQIHRQFTDQWSMIMPHSSMGEVVSHIASAFPGKKRLSPTAEMLIIADPFEPLSSISDLVETEVLEGKGIIGVTYPLHTKTFTDRVRSRVDQHASYFISIIQRLQEQGLLEETVEVAGNSSNTAVIETMSTLQHSD